MGAKVSFASCSLGSVRVSADAGANCDVSDFVADYYIVEVVKGTS